MGNHRDSNRIRLPRRARIGCAAGAAVALLAGIVITPDAALGQDDSLLRAVNVTMSGDGTMTAVTATSITTRTGQSSSSSSDDYSPAAVVDDLPVRIITSYRTEDSSGTDLSELNGYSGKTVIDVSVENLTLASQQVDYDMDGSSHSASALVGAPMTVVASASLGDTAASDVIVEGAGDTTNGLVSRDADGKTQVQWAGLIAPPMLPASAHLRLVVDAKNFSSPDFSISVQPGLATDSSSGALLDASAQIDAQMDLEERAIETAAQVSEVLAQTSATIQDVRSSLDTSADTIGAQTLADMRASAQSLTGTMSSVAGQLDNLKSDLQSASSQSSSQTLAQLTSSIEAMSAMLGDTSGTASDGQATSVYATVQNVASRLQAYAEASGEQQASMREALMAAVGPSEPSEDTCRSTIAGQSSATCALYQGQQSLNAAIESFTTAARNAVDQLSGVSGPAQEAADRATALAEAAQELRKLAEKVNTGVEALSDGSGTVGLGGDIDALNDGITALRTSIDTAKAQADAGRTYHDETVSSRLNDVLEQVCGMSSADRAKLMPLLSTKDCNGEAQAGGPATESVQALLVEEGDKWKALSDSLDRTDTTDGIGRALSDYDAAYRRLKNDYTALAAAEGGAVENAGNGAAGNGAVAGGDANVAGNGATDRDRVMKDLAANAKDMRTRADELVRQADALSGTVASLNDSINGVADQDSALQRAISAADLAKRNSQSDIDSRIRQISESASASQNVFDQSAMSQSARQMTEQAKSSIDAENQALADGYTRARESMNSAAQRTQQAVADSIDRSAADLTGANTLLGNDMAGLLADIGDPEAAGSGMLGSLGTNAALAQSADAQLAVASGAMTGYANVRSTDLGGLLLRRAQMSASLERLDGLPLFQMRKPGSARVSSVYVFSIESSR